MSTNYYTNITAIHCASTLFFLLEGGGGIS